MPAIWRMYEKKITFSPNATREIKVLTDAIQEILNITACAYDGDSVELAAKVEPLEQVIDRMKELLRARHIDRLRIGECGIEVACRHKEWLFLRKRAVDGPFDTTDALYSRLRITNRVYGYATRALCYLVVICFVAMSISMLGRSLTDGNIHDFFEGVSIGLGLGLTWGLTLFYVPAITKLRKQMDRLVKEIGIKN